MSFLSTKIASIAPPSKHVQLTHQAPAPLNGFLHHNRQRKELVAGPDDRLRKQNLRPYCSSRKLFTSPLQRNICKRNANIVHVFSRAAKLAVDECQYQLKYERWNCSVSNKSLTVYGDVVKTSEWPFARSHQREVASSMRF